MTGRTLLAIVMLAASMAGCGRRDDPRPPVPIIPQATSDLVVSQRGATIVLSWSYPSMTTAGTRLTGLQSIVVHRVTESLPATLLERLPVTPPEAGTPPEIQLFSQLPDLVPDQFRRTRETVAVLEQQQIPAYTAGARIIFNDHPELRHEGRPIRITYAVTTVGRNMESPLSNLVSIVPLEVPQPPQNFRATATPTAVLLEWEPPERADDDLLAGYNVYRFPAAGELTELGTPRQSEPLQTTRYEDVPPFGTFRYAVTAVRHSGPPRIETDPTPILAVEYRDLLPPPAPPAVVTLLEQDAIRLVWEPVEDPALAGYRVYRTSQGTRLQLTADPIRETDLRDTAVPRGVPVVYEVTAIDQAGNESAPAATPPVVLPR